MAIDQYAAFAGKHMTPDEKQVVVKYHDAAAVRALFPDNPPRGHLQHRTRGWYWALTVEHLARGQQLEWHGPETSSRKAYQRAMLANQEKVH